MKILLTGHRGFIGGNLLNTLVSRHEVRTYDWGDDSCNVDGCDWVMHIGAISSTTETNVEKVLTQNLDFSIWLLNQCITKGINFQYSSSASVYGRHYNLNTPFKETDPVDPRSPYAWSKYLFERHVASLRKIDITVQGFRYFNVHGPGEEHKGDQASPQHKFRKHFQERGYIELFENSENYHRDFIHVDQIVDYHLRFLNVGDSGVWNIGMGKTKSFVDVANEITTVHRRIKMPEKLVQSYQSYTCADITKLNNTLNKYEKSTNSNTVS